VGPQPEIVYEINPLYNGPHKPSIQTVVTPILAAGAIEFTPWLNQETDLVHILGTAELAAARSDPKLNPLIHFFNNFQSTYISLNTNMPPLDNLDFRKALAHAIDRDTLCQQVLKRHLCTGLLDAAPGFGVQFGAEAVPGVRPGAGATVPDRLRRRSATVTIELYSNARDVFLEFVKQQWRPTWASRLT
jgi:ABC-type transport system substrate-binding protein